MGRIVRVPETIYTNNEFQMLIADYRSLHLLLKMGRYFDQTESQGLISTKIVEFEGHFWPENNTKKLSLFWP